LTAGRMKTVAEQLRLGTRSVLAVLVAVPVAAETAPLRRTAEPESTRSQQPSDSFNAVHLACGRSAVEQWAAWRPRQVSSHLRRRRRLR
jgi:hypothetical protein